MEEKKNNDEEIKINNHECECGCNHEHDQEEIADSDVEIAMLQNELQAKEEEIKDNIDSLQRIMAEFDNYKKRTLKEKETIYSEIKSEIMADFIDVIDNFDKALENSDADVKSIKEGIELIDKKLIDILSKYNVKEIDALNKTFDPNLHESLQHVDDNKYGEKEVIEVFSKGYKINDKVIRYAMVKVAN